MSIYLTGDLHGYYDIKKLSSGAFPKGRELTKDDYLIVLGDFGLVWHDNDREKYWINWLNDKPWTTLFIDGNHENFNQLYQYEKELWKGGYISKIKDSIYWLRRGQVFVIEGRKFFTIGGGESTDRNHRIEFVSWWKEEIPSYAEFEEAYDNLAKHNNTVDYILTHSPPLNVIRSFGDSFHDSKDYLTKGLENIQKMTFFKHWYFGHLHMNKTIGKYTCLYYNIIKLNLEVSD